MTNETMPSTSLLVRIQMAPEEEAKLRTWAHGVLRAFRHLPIPLRYSIAVGDRSGFTFSTVAPDRSEKTETDIARMEDESASLASFYHALYVRLQEMDNVATHTISTLDALLTRVKRKANALRTAGNKEQEDLLLHLAGAFHCVTIKEGDFVWVCMMDSSKDAHPMEPHAMVSWARGLEMEATELEKRIAFFTAYQSFARTNMQTVPVPLTT